MLPSRPGATVLRFRQAAQGAPAAYTAAVTEPLSDARRKLDDEFGQVRRHLSKIHDAVQKVEAAGPEDDLFELLEDLEKTVKEVRTGGLIGSGAKGHREARKEYLDQRDG